MYCLKCKRDVGADALFCPECGTRTEPYVQQKCSGCGTLLEQDALFCAECGQPVGNVAPVPVQKKAPVGIIVAAGVGMLLVFAVLAVFLLKTYGIDISGKEKQAAEIHESEQGEEKSQDDQANLSKRVSDEQDTDKESAKEEKKKPQEVVNVIENSNEEGKTAKNSGKNKKDSVESAKDKTQTETSEQKQTFLRAKDKSAQQTAITTGGQLDLQHMGNLLSNAGSTYGIYVLDITNMQEYDGGSADVPLPASALIGVPILFTIADGVDNGDINLDTPVTLSYTFVNGRGVFKSGDNGKSFPVSQMLSEALLNSDNNALNSLMDFLSLERINDTCHAYGFSSVDLQRKLMTGSSPLENYISAKDAAMMLNAIYQDNFIGIGKAFLETNFKISGSDVANRGMYPACRSCGTFLNLNGITDSRYNEIGLIQNGDEIFILSVFTCNGVGTTSASALTTLTSYVLSTLHAQ